MDNPTPEQLEYVARLLNKLNTSTQQHGVGDLVAALFARVASLEASVAELQAP
uniref:Uncharacterized protein n=1 Tax=Pseudomonas phage Touem01 TaxID=3138548 RepID=A0AAU6W273_9VIRU